MGRPKKKMRLEVEAQADQDEENLRLKEKVKVLENMLDEEKKKVEDFKKEIQESMNKVHSYI